MNRKLSLLSGLTEEKNTDVVVTATLKKDVKAISKALRDATDALEEAEEQLEERLSQNTPLDKSVVEVLYANVKNLKAKKELYEEFQNEYFPKEN